MVRFLSFLLMATANTVLAQGDILQLHGSGTTNPSKCYWLIMDQLMDRMKIPARMTYRAVGSSTGQKEFKGETVVGTDGISKNFQPTNDFGSGDIPISTEDFNALQAEGVEIVHLPIVLGAISLFHSVPGVESGSENGLNLTPCLIAKIFKREITTWDHDEITAVNPNLANKLPRPDYPIQVAHRRLGSSSTASVTQYLRESCPTEWPEDLVGKTINWPEETLTCEGSGGMTNCIRDNEGTIGYIDSGHGHDEGLVEIELQNADGNYISSKEAASRGGIGSAAASIPDSADKDFGNVDLLNKPGESTWPIVAMSYVYVRKDLSHIGSPAEQGLLLAFLKALYEPDYINQCAELFGFTPAPQFAKDIAMDGLQMLQISADAPTFTFESSTEPNIGQGDYVVSVKRRSFAEYERGGFTSDIGGLVAEASALSNLIKNLEDKADSMSRTIETLQTEQSSLANKVAASSTAGTPSTLPNEVEIGDKGIAFTDTADQQITAALAMSSISIVLWAIAAFFIIKKSMSG